MIAEAQLDLTGSKPDQNGLEEADCPFHDSPTPTLFIDHLRHAFFCASCRATGAFTLEVQKETRKRIVVIRVASYRRPPAKLAVQKRERAVRRLDDTPLRLNGQRALDRDSFRDACDKLRPDVPLFLVCSDASLNRRLVEWINEHSPQTTIVLAPRQILKRPESWAVYGYRRVVVEVA